MRNETVKTFRKNLQHVAAVISSQRSEYETQKARILELDGYIFWAERKFAQIIAPFTAKESAASLDSVLVSEQEAEALDRVGALLRVHVEFVKSYLVFLDTAQSAMKKFEVTSTFLARYPGGIMPSKAAGNIEKIAEIMHSLGTIESEIPVQRKALEHALELGSEGKVVEALDAADSAFKLVGRITSLGKAIQLKAIVFLDSKTVQ